MLKKYILPAAIFFPLVILALWTARLQLNLNHARKVLVTVEGYDPRSLISGHYLQLRPVWDKTDCGQFSRQRCPVESFENNYRFYLPENIAPELERLIWKRQPAMQLEFALSHGTPLVRELFIENNLWKDWYAEQVKKPRL